MNHHQFILALSGPSGAGKGSVLEVLKDDRRFEFSVSYTTRKAREGEKHQQHYHFVSDKVFDDMIERDEFAEWEHIHQNRYGTSKADLEKILARGKIPVLEIDVKGVTNFKKQMKDVVSVFIEPPSFAVLEQRLSARGTESAEVVALRLKRYQEEIKYQKDYDYIIVNDDLSKAQKRLLEIVEENIAKKQGFGK